MGPNRYAVTFWRRGQDPACNTETVARSSLLLRSAERPLRVGFLVCDGLQVVLLKPDTRVRIILL